MNERVMFRTETGSVYVIDKDKMRWWQIIWTDDSGIHRHRVGNLIEWPEIHLWSPAVLVDDDVQPGCYRHELKTSLVVERLDIQ